MSKIRLCDVSEIPEDEPLRVDVEGYEPIAVYRVEDECFATSDTCTHMDASLAEEGELDGYVIECTMHNCHFDVRTGEPASLPCTEALKTYPVTVEGSEVFLKSS